MECFDALYTVYQPSKPDSVWYHVTLIQAPDQKTAEIRARNRRTFHFPYMGEERFTANFVGVEKSGQYDHFVGKYVGQFIDEVIWRDK